VNKGVLSNAKPLTNTVTQSASGLTITKAGDWAPQAPKPFFNLVSPQAVQFENTFVRYSGKWIAGWFYGESSWVAGQNRITSLVFDDLEGTSGNINPDSIAALTTLSFPNLSYVASNFSPNTMAALTTLSLPKLNYVGGNFNPATMAALTTLSLPNLRYVGNSFAPATMGALTTFSFPNLRQVASSFNPGTMASLTTLSCPALEYVGANFSPNVMNGLTTFSFPALTFVGNNCSPSTMGALTNLSFPALTTVNGTFSPATMGLVTTLSCPVLSSAASGINVSGLTALTSLSFPALTTTLAGSVSVSAMNSLTTVSYPALQYVGFNIQASTAPVLANFTLPSNGTLKTVAGNVSITGAALTLTSVDHILQVMASLNGTNGTTNYGTGRSINLSGGTSAAPSNAGSVNVTLATSPTLPNLSCSGTTCTVNLTAHGYLSGDVLRVSGVTGATNANRYAVVATVPNANQFTYTITSQTATGAGTANIVKANADAKALVTRGVTLTTN
jgi:hypothetical protein